MGLHDFVHLKWGNVMGNDDECREFICNSIAESTKVGGDYISLNEENLAKIFRLGVGELRGTASRARAWLSQKFSAPKERNGYRLSTCTDPLLVERLEFIRASIYMQDRKNVINGAQVREAKEVRGGSVNRAKLFHKQFHHELETVKATKKSKIGSHIRVIFLSMGKQWKPAEPLTDVPPGFAIPRRTKAKGSAGGKPSNANPPAMRGAIQRNGRVTGQVGDTPTNTTTVNPSRPTPFGAGPSEAGPSGPGPSRAPETAAQDKPGPSAQSGSISPEVSLPTTS
ncbi:unnamed protein product [Calypogeia fissa]